MSPRHVGDGSLHATIVYDSHAVTAEARARASFSAVVDAAIALGGTITGEHGELLKQPLVTAQLGEE